MVVAVPMIGADFTLTRSDAFELVVTFQVADGETVGLLGPNGAGKTTVLDCLAGLAVPDTGRIVIDGEVVYDADRFVPPERRRIGMVFQDLLLFDHLTVAENVAFGAGGRSIAPWMESLQLDHLGDRRPSELSGGQAQRVALARALATDPKVLLLDEPFSALDVEARRDVRRAVADHLDGFAGPRLVVTHDPDEAMLLCDRILVLENGRITDDATPGEIRLRPRTRYAAELVGTNHLRGNAIDGVVDVDGHPLQIADRSTRGPVSLRIRPTAISVAVDRPTGSPRNVWQTHVDRLEPLGDRIRILTGGPLPLTVEVTAEAGRVLGLEPGAQIYLALKATEIDVDSG